LGIFLGFSFLLCIEPIDFFLPDADYGGARSFITPSSEPAAAADS
jgi:hypothetical protein